MNTGSLQIANWLQAQSESFLAWLIIGVLLLLCALIGTLASVARRAHQLRVEAGQLNEACLSERNKNGLLEENIAKLRLAETELAVVEHENSLLKETSVDVGRQLDSSRTELNELRTNYAALQAQTRAERSSLEEKLQLLQKNREQLTDDFELLANKIFEEKTQTFSKNSQQLLDVTLSPLKNQLDEFRKRVDHVYTVESKERHVLQDQIKQLREESMRISEDANNLTRALKADNKSQGNWGELTLTRALEMCGLREPEEYETQTSYKADDNSRQIPDVVVHLPGGKDIIIDSKVSLVAYARYFEVESEEEKSQAISQHLQSVRQHIKQLSDKSYQHLPGISTLDYVMLYIPIEGASAMALQGHRGLWEEAYSKNIVLVSPTNLLAILRSVETIWRHEKQNKNAEEIARQAGNLHDKFVGLIGSMESVGRNLDAANVAYEKAYSQLSTGKGNLVSRVHNLEKLGAKTKHTIPAKLTDAAGVVAVQSVESSAQDEADLSAELDSDNTPD
ncbi:MAG: DNA recombination protein RmuC [Pseudomonadales bacterium]|nr:DNA recombination protein RmuC [Pseudomonadales bacterium]MDG2078182.1 DNA recombination protein RmuC [Pseudomonadales bacterium]